MNTQDTKYKTFPVRGLALDDQTRCAHYSSERDVIAIKFFCCREYYACYDCHQALAGHEARQ